MNFNKIISVFLVLMIMFKGSRAPQPAFVNSLIKCVRTAALENYWKKEVVKRSHERLQYKILSVLRNVLFHGIQAYQ